MHHFYRLLALCAVIALVAPAYAQSDAVPLAEGSAAAFDALSAKAARDGTVRVIVRLDAEFVPEGSLSPSLLQAQRSQIQSKQSSLLGRLQSVQNVRRFRFTPAIALTVDADGVAALRRAPEVAGIQEDVPVRPHGDPAGALGARLDDSTVLIGATAAHTAGFDGTGYEVAILDSGVESTHPFLTGQVVAEACFNSTVESQFSTSNCPNGEDEQIGAGAGADCAEADYAGCSHGTHVAGIAAGNQPAAAVGPTVGVAPGAGIVAINVFSGFSAEQAACGGSPCILSYGSDQLAGLEHIYDLVVNGGRQIASANMSLGGGQNFTTCDSNALKPIIDNLLSVGVATAISSGNNGYQNSTGAPGCISSAITVGSTTKTDALSSFSNTAPWVDLLAPGSSIQSSVGGGNYAFYNGTSMAAPHVTGAFAVLKQRFPSESVAQLRSRLRASGVPITAGSPAATYPRIQIDAAFNNAPVFAYSPTSVEVDLATDGETTATVTLSNTAASGSLGLSYQASLQNVQDQTGMPVSNACTAGQELIQASRTFFTTATAAGFESGQSFVVPCTGSMTRVSPAIYFGLQSGSTFSGTLRVYQGAGTGGTEIASVPFTGTNTASEFYLDIDLPTPIDVAAGQAYTWFLDLTEGQTRMLGSASNPYAGGTRFRTADGNPATATAITGEDMQFKVGFGAPLLWLSVTPQAGVVDAGASEDLTLGIDATGYPTGTYTGDLVVTTNDPDNASVTIPVSMTVGEAGPSSTSIVIGGQKGSRFLGAPADGVTVDDLAAQNLVRGVPGYYPNANNPNLWTEYDPVAQDWVPSTGTGEGLRLGYAFKWLMLDRAKGNPDKSVSVELPFTLSTDIPANTADVDVVLETTGNRQNFLGNPFGTTLDLSGIYSWPGADGLAQNKPVYVFDVDLAAFVLGPTSIEPWGSFRTKANAAPAGTLSLTIPSSAAGGTAAARTASREADRRAEPSLSFALSGRSETGRPVGDRAMVFAFRDGARAAFSADEDDRKLQPLAADYALVGARTSGPDGPALAGFDARPFAAGETVLAVEARGVAGPLTLSWDAAALPDGPPGRPGRLGDGRRGRRPDPGRVPVRGRLGAGPLGRGVRGGRRGRRGRRVAGPGPVRAPGRVVAGVGRGGRGRLARGGRAEPVVGRGPGLVRDGRGRGGPGVGGRRAGPGGGRARRRAGRGRPPRGPPRGGPRGGGVRGPPGDGGDGADAPGRRGPVAGRRTPASATAPGRATLME